MEGKTRNCRDLGPRRLTGFWIDAGGRIPVLPDGGWVGVGEWGSALRAWSIDNQRPQSSYASWRGKALPTPRGLRCCQSGASRKV